MDLLPLLAKFYSTFVDLLRAYYTDGLPFFCLHLLVVYFIGNSWRKIEKEAFALLNWGVSEKLTHTETTITLDQFVRDSENLGRKGFFVPLTDFSDRLDSIIDGRIAELHDRTNLLLLVGIAGTMFGVFEFAFGAYGVLQSTSEGGKSLGEILSESMSKAFPIGFMGILLTLIFQLIATRPEHKLRSALTTATQRALKKREEAFLSQTQVIEQAAREIRRSLEPIQDLKILLGQSIQPVVERFDEHLKNSSSLIEKQFNELQQATSSIHEAVRSVHQGVEAVHNATENLRDILQKSPVLLSNVIELQNQQKSSLEKFDQQIVNLINHVNRVSESITASLSDLHQLPETLLVKMQNCFDSLRDESSKTWRDNTLELTRSIQAEYVSILRNIDDQIKKLKEDISKVTSEFQRLSDNSQELLTRKFIESTDKALNLAVKRIDDVLCKCYPESIKQIDSFSNSIRTLKNDIDDTHPKFSTLLDKVDQIEVKLRDIKTELSNALDVLTNAIREFHEKKSVGDGQLSLKLLQEGVHKLDISNRLLLSMQDQMSKSFIEKMKEKYPFPWKKFRMR